MLVLLQAAALLTCFKTCAALGPNIVIVAIMIWGTNGFSFSQ